MDLQQEIARIRSMKVKELDEYAVSKGFRQPKGSKGKHLMPSSLNTKQKKQDWLIAAIRDQMNGVAIGNKNANTKTFTYSDLTPISFPHMYVSDADKWKKWLFTQGVVVIRDVANPEQILDLRQRAWQWMIGCNPENPINPNNPESWSYDQLHPQTNGIFKTGGVGQELFMWMARMYLLEVFSKIFDTDDVVSSMDVWSIVLRSSKSQFKLWLHADQPRVMRDQCCYQGILLLTDNGPENGGFVFCKPDDKSAGQFFNEYMDKHQSCGIDWSKVDPEDPMIASTPKYKVCGRAGSLILFNSQLIHCNAPAIVGHREAIYVSMQLRDLVDEKTQIKRQKAFDTDANTGHWCYGPWYGNIAKTPNTYGGAPKRMPTITTKPPADCPIVKLLLHGTKDPNERARLKEESLAFCAKLVRQSQGKEEPEKEPEKEKEEEPEGEPKKEKEEDPKEEPKKEKEEESEKEKEEEPEKEKEEEPKKEPKEEEPKKEPEGEPKNEEPKEDPKEEPKEEEPLVVV